MIAYLGLALLFGTRFCEFGELGAKREPELYCNPKGWAIMARKTRGRRKGSKNKGFFWRASHKAWYAKSAAGQFVPLASEDGERLRDQHAPEASIKEAYARFLLAHKPVAGSGMTVWDLAQHYFAHIERTNGAASTLKARADTLFDLSTGYPSKWREAKRKPAAADRLHEGYGKMAAEQLRPHHIFAWLDKHPGWGQGGSRMRLQAIKRMMNFGKESGLIEKNPLRGMKVPAAGARITCISPEQEEALLKTGGYALRIAIRVLIRTGMRPQEFSQLTAAHVRDLGDKMELRFKAIEVKTRKDRIVRVADRDILEAIRKQIKEHKRGPLFRNKVGKPWIVKSLSRCFTRAKNRVIKSGIQFDDDCCLYSCRHTFAKRVLTGYWNNRPVSIELLSQLMGNSPQVCRANYLRWSDSYERPLWEAVG
jgi:site-specific recombinase XerD